MTDLKIGAHVPAADPIGEAAVRDADVVQIFVSNPQAWKKPVPRADAEQLREAAIDIYVHAPYLVNLASPNNRVRIPSRKMLAQTVEASPLIGGLDSFDVTVPVLVENTAGKGNTVMQDLDNYGPLWAAIGDFNVGVCLDTCHTWAAGADLETAVERITQYTGGIALVHANDSRDPFGSHRDRHANFGTGEIPEELLVSSIRDANAPVVVETPGGAEDQAVDIAWLRERL